MFSQFCLRAVSLNKPATAKIKTKTQILVHLICLGFTTSFSGIRLSLKLVAMPPHTIKTGITQGVLNRKKVPKSATSMIISVIVFFILWPYALKAAYAKKPIAIG